MVRRASRARALWSRWYRITSYNVCYTKLLRPAALGSALTHPWITTDYSEALLEFITPPLSGPVESLAFLRDLEQFVYAKIDTELLWCSSMPCVVEGEEST